MAIGYKDLAAIYRDGINSGQYRPGDTLPKQEVTAENYGVNIKTVRQAIRSLESEGLVTSVRRRGTVVRERPPMKRMGIERYAKSKWKFGSVVAFGVDREASGRPWKPTDQTNKTRLVEADTEVAKAYDLPVGTLVYERARLVVDADAPTHTLTSYYRPADVENTPLVDPKPGPATPGGGFAVLTIQGLEPDHISESFYAAMPTPDEIDELQLPAGEPVVHLRRKTYTANGKLVEFARGVHVASRFSWTYTFKIPE
ncbi:MAG: GntR family transcriptional regulator [Gammaproteobacteria bacterium]